MGLTMTFLNHPLVSQRFRLCVNFILEDTLERIKSLFDVLVENRVFFSQMSRYVYIKRGHALEENRNNKTMVNHRNRNTFSIRLGEI